MEDAPPYLPLLVGPQAQRMVDAVCVGRHALPPEQGRVEIVEWAVKDDPIQITGSVMVNGQPALLDVRPSESTVTLVKNGTAIEIQSTLGAVETEDIAGSLQPLDLTSQ
jgi:hypothetical protein